MSKIKTTSEVPSAESFYESIDENYEMLSDIPHIHETMKKYAKLHVREALNNIANGIPLLQDQYKEGFSITKNCVLNCYPDENFK